MSGIDAPGVPVEAAPDRPVSVRKRLFRLVRLAAFALVGTLLALPCGLGMVGILGVVNAPCSESGATPQSAGLAYQDVRIPSRSGGEYAGFFIPGAPSGGQSDATRAQGTIIVAPNYSAGRSSMLYEAAPLVRAGYNVLMYESRRCANKGALSLGYRDVEDIGDALGFLRDNAPTLGIDPARVALHGFSSAGAAATMAGAALPGVRGVLAEGGYHNLGVIIGLDRPPANALEALLFFGIRLGYRLATGDDASVLDAYSAAPGIPPRPFLLIYGDQEITLAGARATLERVKAAAPDTRAALWVVPGADHGGYIAVAGEAEYLRRALPLYDCALLDRCAAWDQMWGNP
ncbi:MAG: hypothetical protein IT323_04470 [Anaerolineae bacterium]|nr:hypothetical protein [Anaerolineae bacterium]